MGCLLSITLECRRGCSYRGALALLALRLCLSFQVQLTTRYQVQPLGSDQVNSTSLYQSKNSRILGETSSLLRPTNAQSPWIYFDFFAAAARALAAFFLLLLIMTIARNVPTTADPRSVRMTGIRMAQTRGGKRFWSGWSSSTNG